jgi:hypothetical protein
VRRFSEKIMLNQRGRDGTKEAARDLIAQARNRGSRT